MVLYLVIYFFSAANACDNCWEQSSEGQISNSYDRGTIDVCE